MERIALPQKQPVRLLNPDIEKDFRERLIGILRLFSQNNIDLRLVGSLGRSASLSKDPDTLRSERGLRDVDTMIIQRDNQRVKDEIALAKTIASPFKFEEHFIGKIIQQGTKQYVTYKDIRVEVDPRVFDVYEGFLFGIKVPTFHPETLFHLSALYGTIRPKDFKALLAFSRALREKKADSQTLTEDLFEPFHKLSDLRRSLYPMDTFLGDAKYWYQNHFSYNTRRHLAHVVHPTRRLIKPICGWIEDYHSQLDKE